MTKQENKMTRMNKILAIAAMAAATCGGVFADNTEQVNEAIKVFDGEAAANMRGGTWKVVYSSAEGPEGRALQVLTERIGAYVLREGYLSTVFVLPLEKDGWEKVETKRDMIVIGMPEKNATLKALLGDKAVPKGGYIIKTLHVNGRNIGRYWNVGPQLSLYCPAPFLVCGENTIDIMELELSKPQPIRGLARPCYLDSGISTKNAANEW